MKGALIVVGLVGVAAAAAVFYVSRGSPAKPKDGTSGTIPSALLNGKLPGWITGAAGDTTVSAHSGGSTGAMLGAEAIKNADKLAAAGTTILGWFSSNQDDTNTGDTADGAAA